MTKVIIKQNNNAKPKKTDYLIFFLQVKISKYFIVAQKNEFMIRSNRLLSQLKKGYKIITGSNFLHSSVVQIQIVKKYKINKL